MRHGIKNLLAAAIVVAMILAVSGPFASAGDSGQPTGGGTWGVGGTDHGEFPPGANPPPPPQGGGTWGVGGTDHGEFPPGASSSNMDSSTLGYLKHIVEETQAASGITAKINVLKDWSHLNGSAQTAKPASAGVVKVDLGKLMGTQAGGSASRPVSNLGTTTLNPIAVAGAKAVKVPLAPVTVPNHKQWILDPGAKSSAAATAKITATAKPAPQATHSVISAPVSAPRPSPPVVHTVQGATGRR
jgi:hypothetical protein